MTFLYSLLISLAVFITGVNVPATWFSVQKYFTPEPKFGAAFTTVASTDVLSDFPTAYNANLGQSANTTTPNSWSGLQQFAGNSSTTKASCYGSCYFGATATSSFSTAGALTLATALTVANGGTGSTTLSANQVLLGSTTNAVNTVAGWGTDNYVLTSTGGTSAPAWELAQSDQSLNYSWTGRQLFTVGATTTRLVASSTAANPLILNTVSYNTPSTRGADQTVLTENGSGGLTWTRPDIDLCGETYANEATSTITVSFTPRENLFISIFATSTSGNQNPILTFNNDAGANYGWKFSVDRAAYTTTAADTSIALLSSGTAGRNKVFRISAFSTTSSDKLILWEGSEKVAAAATAPTQFEGQAIWTNRTDGIRQVQLSLTGGATYNIGSYMKVECVND